MLKGYIQLICPGYAFYRGCFWWGLGDLPFLRLFLTFVFIVLFQIVTDFLRYPIQR